MKTHFKIDRAPQTAWTKTAEIRRLTVWKPEVPHPGASWALLALGGPGEPPSCHCTSAFRQQPCAFPGTWTHPSGHRAALHQCLCPTFPLGPSAPTGILLSHADTNRIQPGAHLPKYNPMWTHRNDPISKRGHILRWWRLGLQHIFLGDTIQPITRLEKSFRQMYRFKFLLRKRRAPTRTLSVHLKKPENKQTKLKASRRQEIQSRVKIHEIENLKKITRKKTKSLLLWNFNITHKP